MPIQQSTTNLNEILSLSLVDLAAPGRLNPVLVPFGLIR